MAGYILLGTLAAFGAFSVIWALFGWLLPGGKGCALVCFGVPDDGILSRYRWLKGLGLLHCPLLIVADESFPCRDAEICGGEELISRLERERNRSNGTGNGDHSGRYQRRGVSEL